MSCTETHQEKLFNLNGSHKRPRHPITLYIETMPRLALLRNASEYVAWALFVFVTVLKQSRVLAVPFNHVRVSIHVRVNIHA